ncbi:SDR family NAD(P)-dependent oxidoreductase [Asanoa sp. NPDC049518]|uniref:SDR family NAD(P)-dependent oxidoreductase n=1 Tax=unclassified Asanoa TaxID=2685164 RepID=UPI00341CF848
MTVPTERPFAVVTGASSGIGYELARQFATHGFDLLVTAEDAGIEQAGAALRRGTVPVTTVGRTWPPPTASSGSTLP